MGACGFFLRLQTGIPAFVQFFWGERAQYAEKPAKVQAFCHIPLVKGKSELEFLQICIFFLKTRVNGRKFLHFCRHFPQPE
jgi:hypothetical protein